MFVNLLETNGALETTSSTTFQLVWFLREEKVPLHAVPSSSPGHSTMCCLPAVPQLLAR